MNLIHFKKINKSDSLFYMIFLMRNFNFSLVDIGRLHGNITNLGHHCIAREGGLDPGGVLP